MTPANGGPAGDLRPPSAAFPRIARGVLSPAQTACSPSALRAFCAFLLLATVALPASAADGGAPPREAAAPQRNAAALAEARGAVRSRPGAPILPDAPQELLPPAIVVTGDQTAASPRAACLAAARRAEQVHGLPGGLLVAIALSESGLHAHALNIGGRSHYPEDLATARRMMAQAPAGRSIMAGCIQVNARVHARGAYWPLDPVRSADWAGGMLRRWYMETGTWDTALRRWHGGSAAGTRQVICRVRAKLEITAPGLDLLQTGPCPKPETRQARRNGAALLEVAEAQDP